MVKQQMAMVMLKLVGRKLYTNNILYYNYVYC